MIRISRIRRDESGFTYVFVGLGFLAFMGASMLAIDVGMLMTSRNQAQNSADAGALAGATALVYNDWNDRTESGPAVQNALAASRGNQVMRKTVDVQAPDVEFLPDPFGIQDRVKVTVYRTTGRRNPVDTLVAAYFQMPTANIVATATAEASPANAETCVKPFTIPDRWIERQTGAWDPDDTFDTLDNKGKPIADPDIYIGPDDPVNYTGYRADRDAGLQIVLKADNTGKIAPSFYNPYDIPGSVGASDYRWNIGNCNTTLMHPGDTFAPEPGNMVGPTQQGIADLIALDPDASWNSSTNKVVSSMKPSPRVAIIPLYDPKYYEEGKHNSRNASLKFVNYLGFFIEGMRGGNVIGRITPVGGVIDRNAGPGPTSMFPRVIRLVQ